MERKKKIDVIICRAEHSSNPARSLFTLHVDGVGVLLAQRFVLLGVEWLALKVNMAHHTDKAGVVPSVAQGLNELITGLNREVAAMTLSAEEGDIIFLTVGLSVLHVEEAVSKCFATGCTHKAGGVPRLPQSVHHFPHDLGVATSTGRGKELFVAVLAVNAVLFLHKADVSQRHVAVVTVKLLRVPGAAESHQEGAPDDAVAACTQRCSAAGSEPLGPLSHAPCHRGERSRAGGDGTRARCDGCRAGGRVSSWGWIGDISRRWGRGLRQGWHLDRGGCHLTRVKFVCKVGVGHPGGSVRGGRGSWRRGWDSSWRAWLRWDRGWDMGVGWSRCWLRGIDAGRADHFRRARA